MITPATPPSGGGGSSSGGTRTLRQAPEVEELSAISETPLGLVLGEQVSVVPIGAPNAGAGGQLAHNSGWPAVFFGLWLDGLVSLLRRTMPKRV